MMKFSLFFLTLVSGFDLTPEAAGDQITSLPGLDTMPSYKMFSGYLDVTKTKKLHYWFVEAQNNPDASPIVLWLNGGPGCSSMMGLLSEHGPLLINDDSTLSPNPYAWNMNANMIYLEAPVGVGFSKGSPDDMKVINDNTTSSDNRDALKAFFVKFPYYASNELYVSGESYAGIYVPTLIAKIVDDPILGPMYNGAIIGNGLYSWEKNQQSLIFFVKYHGLIGVGMWGYLLETCCIDKNPDKCDFYNYPTDACRELVLPVVNITWNGGLDTYNLYGPCAGGISQQPLRKVLLEKAGVDSDHVTVSDSLPCNNDTAITTYLNNDKVKSAIHVDTSITWAICADLNYTNIVQDVTSYIKHTMETATSARLWLYAGDIDMACNFVGGEVFAESLDYPLTMEYTAWNYTAADNTVQIGGWYKKFDRLVWTTVKGAGHMVPTDKPIQAFKMFQAFLSDSLL